MPNDIFTEKSDNVSQDPAHQTTEGSVKEALVGEGKKYKSEEDLAKGYVNAEQHIGTLASENQQLREQLAQNQSVTEALEELKKVQIAPNQSQQENTPPALSEDAVADLVKKTVSSMNTDSLKKANREEASLKMLSAWGGDEGAQKVLAEKAAGLNVSTSFLQGVAETSPNAFYQLVGLAGPQGQETNSDPGTIAGQGVNTESTLPGGGDLTEEKWAFWQKMRREEPNRYHSAAMTARRHSLVQEGKLSVGA